MNNSEVVMADILRREENKKIKLFPYQERMLEMMGRGGKLVINTTPSMGKSWLYKMYKEKQEKEKQQAVVFINECRRISNETWEMLDVHTKTITEQNNKTTEGT
jgi:hypothetical protein